MNEIIGKLYEIEQTAETILNNAKQARDELEIEQKLEEQEFEREQLYDMTRRIERRSRELNEQTDREIAVMTEQFQQQKQQLDELYDNHLEEMAVAIVQRMTEV